MQAEKVDVLGIATLLHQAPEARSRPTAASQAPHCQGVTVRPRPFGFLFRGGPRRRCSVHATHQPIRRGEGRAHRPLRAKRFEGAGVLPRAVHRLPELAGLATLPAAGRSITVASGFSPSGSGGHAPRGLKSTATVPALHTWYHRRTGRPGGVLRSGRGTALGLQTLHTPQAYRSLTCRYQALNRPRRPWPVATTILPGGPGADLLAATPPALRLSATQAAKV